ncbi:hypothetical protein O1D97_15475 [Marinomonas sp. 15G1-11]|uniref:Uncharacterized protein n=1 Tax=Marinomonas phaeophyticola TaxID=3004091 RepID=A0ABT4JXC8_9GAMM|nr:hypothetical protein [Marinomonas sp. 15G1-11]MCZ2722974.1 hypothetical protein [Marinomonas sp. 15G1-11]
MKIIPIATLPVYRLTREEYYAKRDQFSEKAIFGGHDGEFKREYAKKDPIWYSTYKMHLDTSYGGAWDYNEVIGYIELHFMGNQVLGSYWQDNKKRFVKSRKKQFVYQTHKLCAEKSFSRKSTREEIYGVVLAYVESCRKELKGRYIDDSTLLGLGKHIDWISLYKGDNKGHS